MIEHHENVIEDNKDQLSDTGVRTKGLERNEQQVLVCQREEPQIVDQSDGGDAAGILVSSTTQGAHRPSIRIHVLTCKHPELRSTMKGRERYGSRCHCCVSRGDCFQTPTRCVSSSAERSEISDPACICHRCEDNRHGESKM